MSILVPVDDSPCAQAALDRAVALASQLGGVVEVLHMWQPSYDFGAILSHLELEDEHDGKRRSLPEFLQREAERDLRKCLERAQERLGSRVNGRLGEGDPRRGIVDAANDGQFDLVVMGTHGRTGLGHFLLGSVAEWVVRHAHIPVMTVR